MLRDQALNIRNSTARIPGVSANGLNNTIRNLNLASEELRSVSFLYAREFSARFKRMDFEREINANRRNVRKSDALFRADRYMRLNPGRYETATQRINAVKKMREIQSPFGAKRDEYREAYGGDADRILSAEAGVAYGKYIQGITDPIGAKRKSLAEQFGGGARGSIMAINAMRAEARENYRYDMLSDYDRKVEDLTKRYGGGRSGRDKAYDILFKNIPFLKPIAKNLPAIAKPLATIAAHPTKSIGAGLVALEVLDNKIVSASKSATKKEVLGAAAGTPSKELMDIAAGIGEVDSIYQRRRKMMSTFGSADYGYKIIGEALKGKDDFTRAKLMEAFGIDEIDAYIAMQMATSQERTKSAAQKKMRTAELVRLETEYGFSGHGGVGAFIQSVINSIPGMEALRRFDYGLAGYVEDAVNEQFMDYIEKTKKAGEAANQSASLPSQSVGAAASYSGHSNVSVNVGGVVVNTDNAERLGADIISGAMTSPGSRAAIANSLDPMTMK